MSSLFHYVVPLCALAVVSCSKSRDGDPADSSEPEPSSSATAGNGERGEASGDGQSGSDDDITVPVPDFGSVGVEPIEEDGSATGLGVAPNLVETLAEVRDALPLLEAAKLSLSMMIQEHKLRSTPDMDAFLGLVADAQARGVEVRPIPVLSADAGYFPNATNYERFAEVARELVTQWKARGLEPSTLLVDMEPPRELIEALSSLDLAQALPDEHIDRERYAAGTERYAALVEELHGLGFKVAMSTQATLLADYRDDDDDLRQYFNVVIEGPAWDQLEFQLYRSVFASQAPGLGPHFVYDFAEAAQAQFPNTPVGVAIGVTHPGPVFPDTATLDGPAELRKDAAAARAAGVPREHIGVYNLKGILLGPPTCDQLLPCDAAEYEYGDNDPRAWLTPATDHSPPSESLATEALWMQFDLMDGLLDVAEAAEAITP